MSGWHGIPIPFDDRTDWLTKRRTGIGASDVAGILGLSPWSSPFSVWADKTQGSEKEETEAMHFGKLLEDPVIEEFETRTDLYVGMREVLVCHPQYGWVMATLDGVAFENATYEEADDFRVTALGNVQVKTESLFGRWDHIPDHYEAQVQWEMLASGLTHTWIPVLHGLRQFEIYETEADAGVQNRMLDMVSEFRAKHIIGGVQPEVDEHPATTRVISDLWLGEEDETIELSALMAADVDVLRQKKAAKKILEKEITGLENQLKVSLQDATVGTVNGTTVVTWKSYHRKRYEVAANDVRPLLLKPVKEEDHD